jgi:hypothetical protein
MLDFIVLGQIPGTHLQLTFSQVLCISAALVLLLALMHEIEVRRRLLRQMLTLRDIKKLVKALGA